MKDLSNKEVELISFKVAGDAYCLKITGVKEIRGWTKPAKLPHAPDYVRGVINLRGTVIPIIDLASRLGLSDEGCADDKSVIIIAQVEDCLAGLLVEAVSDIVRVEQSDVQPPPSVSGLSHDYIKGIFSVGDELHRVVDLDVVMVH